MSKSRGNVVDPDDLVTQYGADTVRTYLMFAYEWQKGGPWDSRGIVGAHRFLEDVWKLGTADYAAGCGLGGGGGGAATPRTSDQGQGRRRHGGLQVEHGGGGADGSAQRAAIGALAQGTVDEAAWSEGIDTLLLLLAPIAPFVAEEVWQLRGGEGSVHVQAWPEADPDIARDESVTMVVQVNGKVRDRIEVAVEIDEAEAIALALASERVQGFLEGGEPKKVIARPPKLVNIVV